MKFRLVRAKSTLISLGLLCTLLLLLIDIFHLPLISSAIGRLDSWVYDQMLRTGPRYYHESTPVFIVDIDDVSIAKEGRWPWPRDKLAKLLLKLKQGGVVVASFDIIMADPEINYAVGLKSKLDTFITEPKHELSELSDLLTRLAPQVDNDEQFANVMRNYDVVLGFLFHNLAGIRKGILPPPLTNNKGKLLQADSFKSVNFQGYNSSLKLFMEAAHHGGLVTNLPDSDGVIRQGLALAGFNNKVYPSLALATVMRYLLVDHVELKIREDLGGPRLYGVDLGGTVIPTNGRGQILIPFWGPPFTLPFYSATDILHDKVDPKALEGGIAIIGSSMIILSDLHPSPVADQFPGVEMVGNMVAAMLAQQVPTRLEWYSFRGIVVLGFSGLLAAFIFPFLGWGLRFLALLGIIFIILAGMVTSFVWHNHHIPAAFPLALVSVQALSNYLYEFILEKRQKYKIKQLFGQYVPESYVNLLLESPESSTMEGQTRDMTVLFSDIRSFTSTSEGLDASGVKRLLNTFFTPITEIIYNHQGTIDKYVGDMVMAFWGAPVPIADHSRQAILATLAIFKALPEINQTMLEKGLPVINIGIGLGTGLMDVGDMGSKFRRAYTVLGDVVNLASRLESLTKFYGVNILVNDNARAGQDEFLWRAVDKVAVKGRQASSTIYEPLGFLAEASPERLHEIATYHQALELYYAQDWLGAESLFESLKQTHPETRLYQLYIARIEVFKVKPPAEGWDGVYVHTEK